MAKYVKRSKWLALVDPSGKPRWLCKTRRGALAQWSKLRGLLVLDDDDWERFELYLKRSRWKIKPAVMTVEVL